MSAAARPARGSRKWRNWWMRQLHTWHWVSAAVSLTAILLFAITGVTLNHAGSIGAVPVVRDAKAQLPPPLLRALSGR
ncbi:PepSY-associated TM helix domain-containing protein, partial [Sphingomonas bacterium]|uniref:PepSY-associated TM helix domain-containing protein n=1 Tax=Sphingomonas bacterium TaxID=1895847 RepID=UPI0020C5FE91